MYTPKRKTDPDPDPRLPIPQQIISNGEYLPVPQTRMQKHVEVLANEMADERAKKLGVSRRDFLRTAAGTATVMLAMNQVYGCGDSSSDTTGNPDDGVFNVCEEDTRDPERAASVFDADYFIMDVQTHHVELEGTWNPALKGAIAALRFTDFGECSRGDADCIINEKINQDNYIKEMFLDSETAIGVMSGIPTGALEILPNTTMAATRDRVNAMANGSTRMLAQMLCEPTLAQGAPGRSTIWDIQQNVEELGSAGLKCYPGGDIWWLDDEEVAYPMFERAVEAGLKVISVHKGFPLQFGPQSPVRVQSIDIPKAARDWPQLEFVIYHSGYYPTEVTLPDGTVVPQGIEQFASVMEANPDLTNVHAEVGSTFAAAISGGGEGAKILGRLLDIFGSERIIWGTDSVWWGSPQWQINSMKAFQMPEGLPQLTDQDKANIFGLNAAKLYGIDPEEVRCNVETDPLTMARKELLEEGPLPVVQTHGPRTRREFMRLVDLDEKIDRWRSEQG